MTTPTTGLLPHATLMCMATIYPKAFFKDAFIDTKDASLSIASAAVLYGLSVYTVFPVTKGIDGLVGFRLRDHFIRLINSARIIGIDTFESQWTYDAFLNTVQDLIRANNITGTVFVRATVHVDALVPGTRSRGLSTLLSIFIYEATPIVPQNGMRLKTSVWRRVPDFSIPSRAKVNGAYVNSVLAKQDALDSGYDDCLFLDGNGHVCELSAANIFLIRNNVLITPDTASDLLEGINRHTIITLAKEIGIEVETRSIDLTELYIADEAFACGTSAFVAPITTIDARKVGDGTPGPITAKLRSLHAEALKGSLIEHTSWYTKL